VTRLAVIGAWDGGTRERIAAKSQPKSKTLFLISVNSFGPRRLRPHLLDHATIMPLSANAAARESGFFRHLCANFFGNFSCAPTTSSMAARTPQYITAPLLSTALLARSPGIAVVDVRDSDRAGGNIPGSIHFASEETTRAKLSALYEELERQKITQVVFHCALSRESLIDYLAV